MKRMMAWMLVCAAGAMLAGCCDCGNIKNWGPGPMHLSPTTSPAK